MSVMKAIDRVRHLLTFVVMLLLWLILAMVWLDRFFPPFNRLIPLLTPWKRLSTIPMEATIGKSLSIMEEVLNASTKIVNYTFVIMIISFASLSIYLTFVYHQKQRRAQENRFLLLKNQEIARRNEFIRYISATIGHEFKNNLGRIKRRLDLLPELSHEMRSRIDGNLEKLFADIEIFKKISDERESGLIDFARVDIMEMLNALTRQHSDMATVNFQGDVRIPAIFASQMLLKTVFENLIDNAIKYKKPEQAVAQISVSCSIDVDNRRRYVSISFRDEGVGMDEEQADQCFYKGKGSHGGWGQGLYFAKYAIGLHAGKIRIGKEYTSPGHGTEVIINLPFVEEFLYV